MKASNMVSSGARSRPRKTGLISGQIFLSVLFSALVIGGVLTGYQFDVFQELDHYLYDFHFRQRGPMPVSDNIVLVLMDDRSAAELNRQKGHWSRRQIAQALQNLCWAGAEVIGVDMIMADPDQDSTADQMMAEVIQACNNIVLPRVAATQSGDIRRALDIFQAGIIGEGFVDAQLDSDGVWRRMNYFNVTPLPDGTMQVIPSFSLELVRTFLYLDISMSDAEDEDIKLISETGDTIRLPKPDFYINYHGDISAFKHLAYSDVVKGRFDPKKVQGKLVIMGSSLAVNKDTFFTPLSQFRENPADYKDQFGKLVNEDYSYKDYGVSCITHAAESILNKRIIRRMSKIWMVLLILIFSLISLLFYHPYIKLMPGIIILISTLAAAMGIRHAVFVYGDLVFNSSCLLLILSSQYICGVSIQKFFANKKAARVTSMFGRYVSPSVATELVTGDVEAHLEGSQKEVSILFSDLRDFTSISETMSPKEVRLLLNTYFGAMIPLVFNHNGTLDKLVGDMIMAFYGAPLDVPDHPVQAVKTALAMKKTLAHLRENVPIKGLDNLWAGIGINTGPAIVGNLGSRQFIDYTVIGDTVNVASRLEGLNKLYGTHIIISESTKENLGDRFMTRKLDRVKVKGKHEPISIYELICNRSEATQEQVDSTVVYESGLQTYQSGAFDDALQLFEKVLALCPDDRPSELFIERIQAFKITPPPDDWDGVTLLKIK